MSIGENRSAWWVSGKRRRAVLAICFFTACTLVGGAVARVTGLSRGAAGSGWTGAVVKVPNCPADADGCRIFVVPEIDLNSGEGAPIAQAPWSAATTTLNVVLPPGNYAVSAEGCTGYEIASTTVSISPGFHVDVDLGATWEMPAFLGTTCPGFGPGR